MTNGETYLRELYKQIRQSRKRKLDDKENTSQDAGGEQVCEQVMNDEFRAALVGAFRVRG